MESKRFFFSWERDNSPPAVLHVITTRSANLVCAILQEVSRHGFIGQFSLGLLTFPGYWPTLMAKQTSSPVWKPMLTACEMSMVAAREYFVAKYLEVGRSLPVEEGKMYCQRIMDLLACYVSSLFEFIFVVCFVCFVLFVSLLLCFFVFLFLCLFLCFFVRLFLSSTSIGSNLLLIRWMIQMNKETYPDCVGYIGDEILPSYVEIIINHFKLQ